ncbi:hypothetical protein BC332_31326 [Capsicum chinense]|nr:hypothetical protein BC332_31326 [Capsicum chinense]
MKKELAFQEAASTGLKTMEHLIKLVDKESVVQVDCHEIIDFSVAKLNKANAVVGRTGHARFRCGPIQKERALASMSLSVVAPVVMPVQTGLTLGFRVPSVNVVADGVGDMKWKDDFGSMKNGIRSSSFLSFITG